MQQEKGNWKPYNVSAILQNVESIFKNNDIEKLNEPTYRFLTNMSGFIAHYNRDGFMSVYRNVSDLAAKLDNDIFLHEADRIETDSDFNKWYGEAYNKSKAELHRGLHALARKYYPILSEKTKSNAVEKLANLKSIISRSERDEIAQEAIARQLNLI